MAVGIYAEILDGSLSPSIGSLSEFGQKVKAASGEELVLFAAAPDIREHTETLKIAGVDRLVLMDLPGISYAQTDAMAEAVTEIVDQISFSTILVPASHTARALFARVAMKRGIGMTADCSDLLPEQKDGKLVINQIKPSFGAQIMVNCVCIGQPEIVTMKTDDQVLPELGGTPSIDYLDPPEVTSAVSVTGTETIDSTSSLHSAEVVVCAGKGAMEEDNFQLIQAYAEKIGAVVAGTRPMADNGWIPFSHQVGQSGTVIRPKVCITFGVSGAIQFTEGIKGDPIIIAVNSDENAPIFGFADYAIVADMHSVLTELLK